ncbi:MAG: hypothetical protein JJU29_23660 [Verrucomicrobia bacterium]|nr:hypothetical protein [Verrucomicrobiota bacterium]MCH8510361.1 hypothetical protein [Kiritimatiellia bacterium]
MEIPINTPPGYIYMQTKARRYLELGPTAYTCADALHKPGHFLPPGELALLESGMKQILDFAGIQAETPFENLNIRGFYLLMDTLHYQVTQQFLVEQSQEAMLDKMILNHQVSSETITLYNRVSNVSSDTEETAPPLA